MHTRLSDLRFRLGVTGCRILEVPGADTGDKANSLAARLVILPVEKVRVTRPEKSAELRLCDLDDSVTSENVVAASGRMRGYKHTGGRGPVHSLRRGLKLGAMPGCSSLNPNPGGSD